MNHLEAAYYGRNHIWRYFIVLIAVVIIANSIGSLPLILKLATVSVNDPAAAARFAAEPNDPTHLGVDPNTGLAMMMLPFLAALIGFFLLVRPVHQRSFSMVINGTSSIRWKRYFAGAMVWMVLSLAYLIIYLKATPENLLLRNTSGSLIGLILVSVILIPFQAGLEEVLFRGYLMQGFSVLVRKRWFPLLLTSLLFGLLHAFNPEVKNFGFFTMMPHYILFGLVFGIAAIMDDGIEVAAGAHTANNIFLSVMITQESSALQTAAVFEQVNVFPWYELISLLLMGLLFIMILKKWLGWGSFSLLAADISKEGIR